MDYNLDLLVHEAIDSINWFEGQLHDYVFQVNDEVKTVEEHGVIYEEVKASLVDTQTDDLVLHIDASTRPSYRNRIYVLWDRLTDIRPFVETFEKNKASGKSIDFKYIIRDSF